MKETRIHKVAIILTLTLLTQIYRFFPIYPLLWKKPKTGSVASAATGNPLGGRNRIDPTEQWTETRLQMTPMQIAQVRQHRIATNGLLFNENGPGMHVASQRGPEAAGHGGQL
jgi:hypothetical protein